MWRFILSFNDAALWLVVSDLDEFMPVDKLCWEPSIRMQLKHHCIAAYPMNVILSSIVPKLNQECWSWCWAVACHPHNILFLRAGHGPGGPINFEDICRAQSHKIHTHDQTWEEKFPGHRAGDRKSSLASTWWLQAVHNVSDTLQIRALNLFEEWSSQAESGQVNTEALKHRNWSGQIQEP